MIYIDYLLTLNNSAFSKEIANIYPVEVSLKRRTESCAVVSYLHICTMNNRFVTTVYDKRENFDFPQGVPAYTYLEQPGIEVTCV